MRRTIASIATVARRSARPRPPPLGWPVAEAIAGPPTAARVAVIVCVSTLLVLMMRLLVVVLVVLMLLVMMLVLVLVRMVRLPRLLGRAVGENGGAGDDVRARGQRGARALLVLVRDETESLWTLTEAIKDDDDLGQLAKSTKVIGELVCNGDDVAKWQFVATQNSTHVSRTTETKKSSRVNANIR
jgi:hypothetical protein